MGGFSPGEHYPAAPGLIPHHATNSSLSTEGPWPPKDGKHSRVRTSHRFPLTPRRYGVPPQRNIEGGRHQRATGSGISPRFPAAVRLRQGTEHTDDRLNAWFLLSL